MKIFTFYRHVPYCNWVSVTTNINNSSLLIRIQGGDEENRTERQKLRANLGDFVAALDHSERN